MYELWSWGPRYVLFLPIFAVVLWETPFWQFTVPASLTEPRITPEDTGGEYFLIRIFEMGRLTGFLLAAYLWGCLRGSSWFWPTCLHILLAKSSTMLLPSLLVWPSFVDTWVFFCLPNGQKDSSSLRILHAISARLGLLRHPASQVEQVPVTWLSNMKAATVGLPGQHCANQSNKLLFYIHLFHQFGYTKEPWLIQLFYIQTLRSMS